MTTKPTTEAVEALADVFDSAVNQDLPDDIDAAGAARLIADALSEKGFTITRAETAMSEAELEQEAGKIAYEHGAENGAQSCIVELAKKYRGQP